MHKIFTVIAIAASLSACHTPSTRSTYDEINKEVAGAAAKAPPAGQSEAAVNSALLPPVAQLTSQLPKARAVLEERFNVAFNNVPVQQFYNSIVAGTRYNMLVNPDVSGTISANLKDVTLFEALDAVRELYGYDYKVEGTRIYIRPLKIQTRMFHVNYLSSSRKGSSSLRVSSTSVSNVGTFNSGSSNGSNGNGSNGSNQPTDTSGGQNGQNGQNGQQGGQNGQPGQSGQVRDSSNVSNTTASDFWTELKASLGAIIGDKDGQRRHQPAVGRDRDPRHARRTAQRRPVPEGDPAVGRPSGDPGSENPGSAAEQRLPERHQLVDLRQPRQQQAGDRPAVAGFLADAAGRRRHRHLAGRRCADGHPRRRDRHGGHHRRLAVRPGFPDQQFRRADILPRIAGHGARAVQPAHRHAQQPEGRAENRHRRILCDRRQHHHHQHRRRLGHDLA